MMGATSAARVRRCRARARGGKVVLPIEVEIDRLCAVLQAAGLLGNNDDDRQAVIAAFEHAIDLWLMVEEQRLACNALRPPNS
jgi:hypothetical protein